MKDKLAHVLAPMTGIVLDVCVAEGDRVGKEDAVMVIEAMKLESVIKAGMDGEVRTLLISEGEQILKDQPLMVIFEGGTTEKPQSSADNPEKPKSRSDLEELVARKKFLLDTNRGKAVDRRKAKGKNMARENIDLLCDHDSFLEYGSLILPAQRGRRSLDDLIENTPSDGLVSGIGRVNGNTFSESVSQCFVLSYDYTVLAGTQGFMGHKKTDRILHLALTIKLPVIFFVEGGGGRPGDTDFQGVGGLDVMTFYLYAKLNGLVPRIAIVGGYCFAGNAALAGSADVIIATEDSSLGMGGPAMIEGGGLGQFHPREVGPSTMQSSNGVIDILAKNEAEAIYYAQKYLGYFQGKLDGAKCADQATLRSIIPENRRRIYDVREVINILGDTDSFLELRQGFGKTMVTGFVRIDGHPLGLIANDPRETGGAIDSDGADKGARFMQLCDAFGIPILSLCDTPGIMVGPEAEQSATVRHANRLFLVGAKLDVPIFMVVTRRAYGLGSMAMAGGSFHVPKFTISWPTGEFGGMGLEGAIKLGYRKELEAIDDPKKREALYDELLAKAYETGKAINTASFLEIDEVIDPADTRKWILNGIISYPRATYYDPTKIKFVDAW